MPSSCGHPHEPLLQVRERLVGEVLVDLILPDVGSPGSVGGDVIRHEAVHHVVEPRCDSVNTER